VFRKINMLAVCFLLGALATKQPRGRVMRPLGCFAALAMTGRELALLFLGEALV
jgi:hypothetical protein